MLWRLTLRSFRDGLRYLSNFYCLPGGAGGSPNGLAAVEATVEAAVTGERKLMTEALILDASVPDYRTTERLTEDLLRTQAPYLPQFN